MIREPMLFKNELKTYRYYVKQRKANLDRMKRIEDSLCSLHSSSPKTIIVHKRKKVGYKGGKPVYKTIKKEIPAPKVHSDPKAQEEKKLDLIEMKADFEEWYLYFDRRIKDIEDTLNCLPQELKQLCIDVYVNKLVNRRSRELGYTVQGLYRHIDIQLNKVLKNN